MLPKKGDGQDEEDGEGQDEEMDVDRYKDLLQSMDAKSLEAQCEEVGVESSAKRRVMIDRLLKDFEFNSSTEEKEDEEGVPIAQGIVVQEDDGGAQLHRYHDHSLCYHSLVM